jgi:hypothetical protein
VATNVDVRIAAVEAASRTYAGAGSEVSVVTVINRAQFFEHYILTGKND